LKCFLEKVSFSDTVIATFIFLDKFRGLRGTGLTGKCFYTRREGICGDGGINPLISNLDCRWVRDNVVGVEVRLHAGGSGFRYINCTLFPYVVYK
jgi:hypothetical protein